MSQHNNATTQQCHNATMSQHNNVTTQQCHNTTMSQRNNVTTQQCHNATMSQRNNVTTQQCHNTKSVIFQEKLLEVLKCYNFLWVQRRHNCSPVASFANWVMTLHLLKVHLQTFLSMRVTQKCQILSCDSILLGVRYLQTSCWPGFSKLRHGKWRLRQIPCKRLESKCTKQTGVTSRDKYHLTEQSAQN